MEVVVGLEVHCQLGTASKLFCPCPTDSFGKPANTAVCPVCAGHPGVLPVLNRRAVELAFTAAMALECRLRPRSIFARKNYFYPDLPKGYQISQYEEPFSEAGALEIAGPPARRIGIHRVHMEEDAGKLMHAIGSEELDCSLVDLNRAGVPLIEIVSEPDMRSSEEAWQYLTQLKAVLQYAGVSRCDMEKGEMRCDANVSVRPAGASALGVKVEIKNLNSFRAVRDAIDHEFKRQCAALESGERLVQETRLWDASARRTEPMRSKEEAHDYRYFPDPDLVPLTAAPALVDALRRGLPELPAKRRARLASEHPSLSSGDVDFLISDKAFADKFEAVAAETGPASAKLAANYLQVSPEKSARFSSAFFASLVRLTDSNYISMTIGKQVVQSAEDDSKDPKRIVEERNLAQVSDASEIERWVLEAIGENPRAAADVKAGKAQAAGAIVGAVMKRSKGKANPALVNRLIQEKLK